MIESEQKILVGGILKFHAQLERVDGFDHVIFPPVYNQVGGAAADDNDDVCHAEYDDEDDGEDDDLYIIGAVCLSVCHVFAYKSQTGQHLTIHSTMQLSFSKN